ncbi:MAG: TlpA disulfide reductase family protein [bacterium]
MRRKIALLAISLLLIVPSWAIQLPEHQNKPTIISFFASWSKSCQKELAFLDQLAEKHKKSDLKVIGVAYDRKTKELEKFISDNKIGLEIVHNQKLESIKEYKILILPTLVVIDKEGKIIKTYVDFDENVEKSLSKDLDKLLE